jgi:hypothetical protein
MHAVDFIPADWVERAAWWPGLTVYSRPVAVERRVRTRRTADVELLLRSLLSDRCY